MRLACVGDSEWCELVQLAAPDHEHVRVEHVSPRDAMPFAAFNPGRFDVVAVAPAWAEGMVEIAAAGASHRVAAHALLAEHGPSLFVPSPDGGFALAGHGVVNPSSMLFATALTLEHGLGQPAAAETLAGAVSAALVNEPVRFGVRATTREFTSRVLGGFQLTMRNAEFWPETV
jgi:isocitrate/isopropylmalate dehydrogenase